MELNSELDRLQKYAEIDSELNRAKKKWPDWPENIFEQLAIMQEEAGEVTMAVLHYVHEGGNIGDVKSELIHTAAMCMRMLENLPDGRKVSPEKDSIEGIPHKFKAGDIVYEDGRIMIVKEYPNSYYCLVCPKVDDRVVFNRKYGDPFGLEFDCPGFRYATEEEKNTLFVLLKKNGKRWNAEKLCIEDIPQRKFKPGDKVRIKNGILSQIDTNAHPDFNYIFCKYEGRILTVSKYRYVSDLEVKECGFIFNEDWLELYKEEKQHKFKFKKGDKVKIKEGILNHTHYWEFPGFTKEKDAYIGKVLTVYEYGRFL